MELCQEKTWFIQKDKGRARGNVAQTATSLEKLILAACRDFPLSAQVAFAGSACLASGGGVPEADLLKDEEGSCEKLEPKATRPLL